MKNKETGKKTRISHEQGQHVMHVWVPARREVEEQTEKVMRGDRSSILTEGNEVHQGFARQAQEL